jgi:hypothetical protein
LCIFLVGQITSSFITNWYLFAFCYGMLGGIAQGGLMILPLYCSWRYFPESYKSLISGIILSAPALAPVFTSIIALKLINPHNLSVVSDGKHSYFPPAVYQNVPKFFVVFGILCFVLGNIGLLLIWEPLPEEQEQPREFELVGLASQVSPADDVPREQKGLLTGEKQSNYKHYDIHHMNIEDVTAFFKDETFRQLYLITLIGYMYPHFILLNFKQIGLEKLTNADKFLNYMGGFSELFNAGSRLLLGIVFHHYGYNVAGSIIVFIEITSSLTFMWMAEHKATFGISLCYFFICYGGQLGIYPLVSQVLFRGKSALAYSLLFSSFAVSCIAISLIHRFATPAFGVENMMFVLCAVSLIPIPWMISIHRKVVASQNVILADSGEY